jgi:hypothetical protein
MFGYSEDHDDDDEEEEVEDVSCFGTKLVCIRKEGTGLGICVPKTSVIAKTSACTQYFLKKIV